MPTVRLRKRLLDRLLQSANTASELGLALLMTAGVVHCGGGTTGPEGGGDAAADHGLAVEAAQGDGGPVIEAPLGDASVVEGADATVIVEAPPPPKEAGSDAHGPVVEAAIFPDGGGPMIEAPSPL
jgi:hypothetical protein